MFLRKPQKLTKPSSSIWHLLHQRWRIHQFLWLSYKTWFLIRSMFYNWWWLNLDYFNQSYWEQKDMPIKITFSNFNFSFRFLSPNSFSNLNLNCSNCSPGTSYTSILFPKIPSASEQFWQQNTMVFKCNAILELMRSYCHFKWKRYINIKISWSRSLVKSRQKNGRDSRSRETESGEKIAVTNT